MTQRTTEDVRRFNTQWFLYGEDLETYDKLCIDCIVADDKYWLDNGGLRRSIVGMYSMDEYIHHMGVECWRCWNEIVPTLVCDWLSSKIANSETGHDDCEWDTPANTDFVWRCMVHWKLEQIEKVMSETGLDFETASVYYELGL